MNIYITHNTQKKFLPTFLYVKQHPITKKCYFGKTTGTEKYLLTEYNGSGKYWNSHLRKHGSDHIKTLWFCLFLDKEAIVEFCEVFCKINNIGNGDTSIWANLKPENGIDGGDHGMNKGRKQSPEHIAKLTALKKGNTNAAGGKGISRNKGIKKPKRTAEHCDNISASRIGVKRGPYKKELIPRKLYKKRSKDFDK